MKSVSLQVSCPDPHVLSIPKYNAIDRCRSWSSHPQPHQHHNKCHQHGYQAIPFKSSHSCSHHLLSYHSLWSIIIICFYLLFILPSSSLSKESIIDPNEMRLLALRFGKDVYEGSAESTCLRKITANFEELEAKVAWADPNKMMDDMRNDVMNMLNWKKVAVERIANESERLAANHTFVKHLNFDYMNMKKIHDDRDNGYPDDDSMKPLRLSPHPNFENALVNLDQSAIHVPINVYERSSDLVNDIKWSEALTQIFKNNLAFDPGLSWQFFGSSTGFLRLYPATKWRTPSESVIGTDINFPDLYDCRMRPWYIQSAASSKDVVILLDGSGSMTGLRRDIARNTVFNILDTLTDDDYVAGIRFSNNIEPIVPCFDTLVQANKKNVREIKEAMENVLTQDIANFTKALVYAFDMLQKQNRSKLGSQCNQAIMLVTDGAPNTYEEVFIKYNWPNIPVRVFTYLIGREVTDQKEVNWIACHNRGYYTHVSSLAEVREQVQKYIPVMSRPIVLSREKQFTWTPVYADVSEVQLTDWVWEEREKAKIRKHLREQRGEQLVMDETPMREDDEKSEEKSQELEKEETEKNAYEKENLMADQAYQSVQDEGTMSFEPENSKKPQKTKKNIDYYNDDNILETYTTGFIEKVNQSIQLMTTLATTVFDVRNYTNITSRVLVKNVWQDSEPMTIRIANILGIAGIDVPIKEIVKLTPAYKLGVNGYSFVITNNGYLLYHPDLRPMFLDMLKPFYQTVDLSEVEIANNVNLGPREIDATIDAIRQNMINRTHGWNQVNVSVHLDSNMRRVVTRTNHYYYGKIDHTPFSLAIVLPDPYGLYKVEAQIEVKHKKENFTHYFRGSSWRVHPDWVYCDNPHKMSGIVPKTPEDAIRQFLNTINNGHNFRWKASSTRPQVYDKISCDKELMQSLVFDAKATDVAGVKCGNPSMGNGKMIDEKRLKMFGIVTTFVATRSGLSRFEDHRSEEELNKTNGDRPFYEVHTKATEEIYYRRAVDFHRINNSAFVFSVPFDAGEVKSDGEILVTGSHAIFLGNQNARAPAAVVGLQFRHSVFVDRFFNITSKLGCLTSDEVDCYLLDNNAFVIASEDRKLTGKFFGEIDGQLLEAMVVRGIYRKVRVYDYQSICFQVITPSGPASYLLTPLAHFKSIITWFFSRIILFYTQLVFNSGYNVFANEYNYDYYEEERGPNKTRPYPCDKEIDLYEMQSSISEETITGKQTQCSQSGCDQHFTIQYVPHTNLIMLAVENSCGNSCEPTTFKLEPIEIVYNESERCDRLKIEKYRKRPLSCVNYHPQEKDIKQCGKGTNLLPSVMLMLLTLLSCAYQYRS